MSRPSRLIIEPSALLHNLNKVRNFAPGKKIIAMIKANAYGCGMNQIAPVLEGHVHAFGIACLEEALFLRSIGIRTQCILFQGIFDACEIQTAALNDCAIVLHHSQQLEWLANTKLSKPVNIWVKVNTGMNRLGFKLSELNYVMDVLKHCSWINKDIGLMSHLSCADTPNHIENQQQIDLFHSIQIPGFSQRSLANSGAIISLPDSHLDVIRPGIMLYGVSPFNGQTGKDLGLKPVMRFISGINSIQELPAGAKVGYQGTWSCDKSSLIGLVAAGYGDGYPRHIRENTKVWIKGKECPIVGRISMDNLAIDLSDHRQVQIGDEVELWGDHIPIEQIAQSAGTIPYELLCQVSKSVRLLFK